MSKIFNKSIIDKAARNGLLLAFLAGATLPAMAQDYDDVPEDTTTIVRKRIIKKPGKQYPTKSVSGRITDNATGEPMGGVRIQALQMPRYSVLTEEDGTYQIDIPTFCDVLTIEAEGYNLLQLPVKGNTQQDASLLSGTFGTFYTNGTDIISRRKAVLNETSTLTVETDMQNLLEGDLHSVGRNGIPGIGAYFTIRGVNSINANAQPLVIIDGNMVDLEQDRTSLHEGYFNNLLAGLDPENVESIEVIKNATAIYGAKGANGVIKITTKRGRSMATKINVRIYGGVELTPSTTKMMGGDAYRSYLSDLVGTITKDPNKLSSGASTYAFLSDAPRSGNYYYSVFHNNTDWQKDLYRTAWTQNYKVSVEGGDDVGMYMLSIGYTGSDATLKGNDYNRLNLRFNTDIEVFEKLNTAIDISYNQVSYNILDNGWSENYDMQNIGSTNVLGAIQAPFLSPYAYYHDEGTGRLELSHEWAGKYAAELEASHTNGKWVQNPFHFPTALNINESLRNPYWIIQNGKGVNKNHAEMTQIELNVAPKYQITKQLSIADRFNYTLNRNNEKYFLPINGTTLYMLTDLGEISSVLKSQFTKETSINNDFSIEWGNNYGAHNINVFGGWRYNNYNYSYTYMRGYNNENDKLPNISKNMQYVNYGGTKDNWIDMTLYAQADYNYKNRYFAQFQVGAESSSRFGKKTEDGVKLFGVSWGVFPSLQLGWLITSEPWFKAKGVNYLKLTAGVDQSGNDGIDYYAARTYWESQQVSENTVGLVLKNIENTSIQWETTTRYNVALQGSFLNNRLNAGIDLFWSKTDNLLALKELDYISGLGKYWTNDGQLKNRGFEMHASAALISKKNWKWEVGASVGHYNNKITKLPETNKIDIYTANGSNTVAYTINGYTTNVYGNANVLTAVGHAAGSFYGWQTNGVLSDDATASNAGALGYLKYPTGLKETPFRNFNAGDVCFVDQNGDGVIDDNDKVVIGNPNPDIFGNIFTSLTWKSLRLDMNFKYSLGNDVYNYQRSITESGATTYNQTTAMQNRWTYEGQHTDMPRACYAESDDWRNNERFSDRWIEDGSYLKLKNVRLTYVLPIRNDAIQGIRVWGEAGNLFTLTRYLGTDPETSCRNSALYQGIDTGMLSLGRNFNLGVTINL